MKKINKYLATVLVVALAVLYSCGSDSDSETEESDPEPERLPIKKDTNAKKVVPEKTPTNTFLVISDSHLHKGVNQDAIPNSDADSGEDLWKITTEKFRMVIDGKGGFPKPDFIVLLGDLPWHANPTDSSQLTVARQSTGIVLRDLREAAQAADVPLIYSPGNNDSWSGDYRAFTAPNGEIPFDQDSAGVADWPVINSGSCGVNSQQACIADKTEERLGCYSTYPLGEKGGLRMITLNTVMFAKDGDAWHYYGPKGQQYADTQTQMDWFKKQFTEGDTTDAIMIGVHIPPGVDAWSKSSMWNDTLSYDGKPVRNAFLDIIAQNQHRIVGMLTSHTHMDGLRKMMYNNASGQLQFSDLIVSVPGIAPGHGNNPGMKHFSYDPTNFEWLNFTTIYNDYWSTQSVSSTWGNNSFSFDDVFGGTPGTPMHTRVAQMKSDSLLQKVSDIYTAKGQGLGGNDVSVTLEVKPL